jgi:hypothetical protein
MAVDIIDSWDVAPFSLLETCQCVGGETTACSTLKMTARLHSLIPNDCDLNLYNLNVKLIKFVEQKSVQ